MEHHDRQLTRAAQQAPRNDCGSFDACATYDGHTYCCGEHHGGDGSQRAAVLTIAAMGSLSYVPGSWHGNRLIDLELVEADQMISARVAWQATSVHPRPPMVTTPREFFDDVHLLWDGAVRMN